MHDASPRTGNHVRCYCAYCRAAVLFTTGKDPGSAGVELYQTTPDKISFRQGRGNLAVFSFSPRKMLRWRAGCCGVPMFTMLPTPKFALAGMMTNLLEDTSAIGPVAMEAFIPRRDGKSRHSSILRLYGGTLWRAARARISGRWKQTHFFDITTGLPTAPVHVVTPEQRASLPLPD